ncbi:hypothetical protein GCM10023116_01630 [Kistimonas scapharcae]|uniref:Uncharacterized protein n=1 Tax=Kistimonas scapharcae TaxID=1036133 RepID=A0ABP8UYA2_9GAMM
MIIFNNTTGHQTSADLTASGPFYLQVSGNLVGSVSLEASLDAGITPEAIWHTSIAGVFYVDLPENATYRIRVDSAYPVSVCTG